MVVSRTLTKGGDEMPRMKKRIMGDAYKAALAQKQAEDVKQGVKNFAKESVKRERVAKAKRRNIVSKHQRMVEQKSGEVRFYENRLKELRKKARDIPYDLMAKIGLGISILIFFLGLGLRIFGVSQVLAIILMLSSLMTLMFSTFFQAISLETENRIKDYAAKLKTAKRELEEMNTPPPD